MPHALVVPASSSDVEIQSVTLNGIPAPIFVDATAATDRVLLPVGVSTEGTTFYVRKAGS